MAEPVLRFEYPGGDKDDGRGDPGRKHFYLFKTDRAVSEVQIFEKGAKAVVKNRCAVCRTPIPHGAIYCREHLRTVLAREDDRRQVAETRLA